MNSGRSCILTYHSVDATESVISVCPRVFRDQMNWLAESGTRVVPLSEIRSTPGSVALTFDDGFQNFFEQALPVLQEHRFPATVFVVSGYCGGANNWPSQPARPPVPQLNLMGWNEVEQAAQAGISVGAHTVTHPFLSRLSHAEVEEELRTSCAAIEDRTGRSVTTFAYPYGDSSAEVRQAAARHFSLACGTRLAFVSSDSDSMELPRLDVFYLQRRFWFQGLRTEYGAAYLAARRSLRSLRRWGGPQ
ncbi:MAG TPA: polysaccharide deacetylase family protein [Bryobacteraceae bacterium]|jgi:peptidoglycan/xylan/chitin deacetylase (PgdA/CDA1 family)